LALAGWITGGWDESPAAPIDLYGDLPHDAKLLQVDREALDKAYNQHVQKLFTVWLTDGAKDATYFRKGMGIARGAYAQAVQAIERRDKELKGR
jgi:hypothetical protein